MEINAVLFVQIEQTPNRHNELSTEEIRKIFTVIKLILHKNYFYRDNKY
jgi:hypothetical protein